MRAGRLFWLFFALGLAGIVPVRSDGLLPVTIQFADPLSAESGAPASVQPATDPESAPSDAGDDTLPSFVPGNRALTLSAENSSAADAPGSEPDGASAPAVKDEKSADGGSDVRAVTITTEPILGTDSAETASLKSTTEAPKWPEFVGAKSLFGAVKKPAPLTARAIGYYSRGCLSGAVPLPIDGPAWQEMRLSRNRNWGHPELISLIERFATESQKLDGWPGLLVGDIAQPRGGPMRTGHASHQVGLDADIWLTPMPNRRLTRKERENLEATSMLDKTGVAVDPKVFTGKQVSLIKRAASYPEVERIFVHPAIKKALCTAAGLDRAWLGKVRPYYGHYYHFHVRIKCPAGFEGCKSQVPPTGDDGCGKEVDQWLAKVIPAKPSTTPPVPKPRTVSVRPPKPPVMLADLPDQCRELLAAKPEPVRIPQEALITKAGVAQALKKAAAARAAFAKAEGIAIVPASAAAAHPALRPHVKKPPTATAEKK
jgi:penicillin-insensitive murein endopeptidase